MHDAYIYKIQNNSKKSRKSKKIPSKKTWNCLLKNILINWINFFIFLRILIIAGENSSIVPDKCAKEFLGNRSTGELPAVPRFLDSFTPMGNLSNGVPKISNNPLSYSSLFCFSPLGHTDARKNAMYPLDSKLNSLF